MDTHFQSLIAIIAPIFLVMGAGFGMRKVGVLSGEADRSLSRLVVILLIPCLAWDSIIGNEAFLNPSNWILPPVLGFLSVALGIGISRLALDVFRIPGDKRRRTFVFVTSIQNYGYIPLPLCQALFGRTSVGVLFAFWMGVELAFWSIALWQLTGNPGRVWWRSLNPPIVAIPCALILNALGAGQWLPGMFHQTLHILGISGVPMGLLLSGALLADYANRTMLNHGARVSLASIVVRIGVVPALMIAAAKFLPVDPLLKSVIIVQAAMPAAIFPITITRLHEGNVPASLQIVVGTSLVSLITIPLWISYGLKWAL